MRNPVEELRKIRRARRIERLLSRLFVGVAGALAVGIVMLTYRELPALRRYLRIERM